MEGGVEEGLESGFALPSRLDFAIHGIENTSDFILFGERGEWDN